MDVDPDGMADLALVQSGSSPQWLRTIERSTTPAQMVLSSQFPLDGADTTPPTAPTNLTGKATPGLNVTLNWGASTDNSGGAVTYRIYRDGVPVGTLQTGLTYVDHPSKAGYHTYSVFALDGSGNKSASSNKIGLKAIS